jgi:hypothetical protein
LSETLATEQTNLQTQAAARQGLFDELRQEVQQLGQATTEREELEQQRISCAAAMSSIVSGIFTPPSIPDQR